MHMNKFLYFFLVLFMAISCSRSDDSVTEPPAPASRTVMVYMAANNSLASDAYTNLNQMEEGFTGISGKLVVYARIFGQQPKLYEIVHDTSPEIKSKVLKTYSDHNSSDPAIMKMVFDDIKNLAPAYSYGAILWSHATNWAPVDVDLLRTRSFGDDNYKKMEVQQLKEALPSKLDFLIFDACSMASVEVLYELRDTAPYILASPTEVLSVGMPYHKIDGLLFNSDVKTGLTEIAKAYVAYYQEKTGQAQSATFSVVDTKQMALLAQETKQLLINNPTVIPTISRTGVQRLDLDPNTPVQAFDFADMLDKHFSQEQLTPLKSALAKAVVFKANTPSFLGKPITAFSGLSVYIPVAEEAKLAPFYKTLAWSKDSGYSMLLRW
ncbi:clostripain [Elizabethkingia meningoseptica]|nr:clostripain [Elizabethkingia meningoseptica]AQX48749.1 clostripain [Elizabethkingia meningoseptica]KUY14834.1 clostripain [Elizabethkingia meningoseptica]OPB69795.1 clostripain [Elizabethkingia meningoseptica]OPC33417.1 clostripain [Elizabethkingia meningoseptica]